MSEFGLRIGRMVRTSGTKEVRELSKRRPDVHQSKTRYRAAGVVAGQQCGKCRRPFNEVVSLPESRPRNEYQEQSRFEEERDEKQPSEQGSASRLHLREPFDLARNIAIAARFRFEFDEHGERPRLLPR
jgi:hypothetical protein